VGCILDFRSDRVVLRREVLEICNWTIILLTSSSGTPQLITLGAPTARDFVWLDRRHGALGWDIAERHDASAASMALRAYFKGDFTACDGVAIDPGGSTAQRRTWDAMRRIPAASVASYKLLAASIGRAGAYRSVAFACAANPIPIFIPSHRLLDDRSDRRVRNRRRVRAPADEARRHRRRRAAGRRPERPVSAVRFRRAGCQSAKES
jgi:O-6-methylguanine DNA methyltransferase